jgi:DHA1 family multidrug resistance protein-like MFS transporter
MVFATRSLLVVFAIRVLNTMSAQIVGPMMSLFVQDIAPAGVQIASLTGLIAGLSAAASAVGAVTLGRLADRIGPRPVLLVCSSAACVLYALQAGVQTVGQLMILRTIAGLASGGILASVSALLAALAPRGRYGAVYGVNTSMVAAANAIAPMIGAAMTARWGLRSVFLGAAVMYGAAILIAAFALPARPAERSAQVATD